MDLSQLYGFIRYKLLPTWIDDDVRRHLGSAYTWKFQGNSYNYHVIDPNHNQRHTRTDKNKTILYFKGGAGVMNNCLRLSSATLHTLAHRTNSRVVILDYPAAPALQFPDIQHLCTAFTDSWLRRHHEPTFILGFGYGANIATVVATLLSQKHSIRGIVLYYPVLFHGATDTLDGQFIRKNMYRDPMNILHWRASPLLTRYGNVLPRTLLILNENDSMLKQQKKFIKRLRHVCVHYSDEPSSLCFETYQLIATLRYIKGFFNMEK